MRTERPRFWHRQVEVPGTAADRTALATLALAVTLMYGTPLFRGTTYFQRDVQLMWLTHAKAFVEAVRGFEWPTWNPWIAFGQPLWADANTQVLYPPTWLLLVLEPWHYYVLFVVGHMMLAAAGLYVLSRALGLSRIAAWMTAGLWVCSGPLASVVPIWNQLAGAAWMPWTVLFALEAVRTRRVPALLLWGGGHALQILAGAPEAALMTGAGALAAAAWTHVRPTGETRASAWRLLTAFAAASVIALGLAAGQWMPSLEAARRSARGELSAAMRTQWSVHPIALAQSLIPVALPDVPLEPVLRRGVFESTDLFPSLYVGAAGIGLAGLAFAGKRRPAALALLLCAVAAAAAAMGRHAPFENAATSLIPFARSFRYPVKAMLAASLAWSLLCGLGLDAWREAEPSAGARTHGAALAPLFVWASSTLLLLAVFLGMLPHQGLLWPTGDLGEAALRAMVRPVAIAFTASVAVLLLCLLGGKSARVTALIGAVAVADLALVHAGLNPTAPIALFTYRPPAAGFLAHDSPQRIYVQDYFTGIDSYRYLARADPFAINRAPRGFSDPAARALALRLCLFPPSAGWWGLRGSFDRDTPALAPEFLGRLTDAVTEAGSTAEQVRLLQVGAVSHVLALHDATAPALVPATTVDCLLPAPGRILRVPAAVPRSFAVGRAREGDAVGALLEPGFDPIREVMLAPHGNTARPGETAGFQGTARVVSERTTVITLRSDTSGPGYVVLADAYDPGWTATVDKSAVEVFRANVGFRAVAVPAGAHEVEFRYDPPSVRIGLRVSTFSVGVVLALALGAARSRRRRSTTPKPRPENGTAPASDHGS